MTDHDPRPPTDDELRDWRKDACFVGDTQDERFRTVCDALLSERAAHLATKAENAKLRSVAYNARRVAVDHAGDHAQEGPDEDTPDAICWTCETTWPCNHAALEMALAALADPEEPHK